MFTGIISDLAQILDLKKQNNKDLLLCLKINNHQNLNRKLEIGCSISCNGICLTLINLEKKNDYFSMTFYY